MEMHIELSRSYAIVSCTAALAFSLLAAMLLAMGLKDGPVRGVHTIRADDRALSLVREAGCSFVVQLFD
jgi:hypothetical protein